MKPCEHSDKTRAKYEQLIGPLRETARAHGYALGVHGSLLRDIDLIAAPWVKNCAPAKTLAEALLAKAKEVNGIAFMGPPEADDEWFQKGCPGMKPHGRLVWSFHLGGGPYLDLSVLPAKENAPSSRDGAEKVE